MRKLKLRKCASCNALVKVIEDCHCHCGIICCGEQMEEVRVNADTSIQEKHLPSYHIENGKLVVKVNHVMEEDHHISWICLVGEDYEEYVYLNPNEECVATFERTEGTLYAYCNKHGLWEVEIG